jgi:hypothetical protein
MPDRIPPRVDTPVDVTIAGLAVPMRDVTLSIAGAGGGNGTATINGAATADLGASATVNLRGVVQTTPGKAGPDLPRALVFQCLRYRKTGL